MGRGIAGFFSLIGIDLLLVIVALNTVRFFSFSILIIGLVQLVFVIPICIFKWKNDKQFAQGMIIGAALVFIINSLCWGLLRNL